MQTLTDEGRRLVKNAAARSGVSEEAALAVLMALAGHGGGMAQFDHPDLGGMGQWTQGGMIMIGDMFNQGLKSRVDALCTELAQGLRDAYPFAAQADQLQKSSHGFVSNAAPRWPDALGDPASTGSQCELHYAVFPERRRLALEVGGKVTIYDTGDHRITGFGQAQGGGQSLILTSQHGPLRLEDLAVVSSNRSETGKTNAMQETTSSTPRGDEDIFSRLERLAALRERNIITQEEFDSKKAELLAWL